MTHPESPLLQLPLDPVVLASRLKSKLNVISNKPGINLECFGSKLCEKRVESLLDKRSR